MAEEAPPLKILGIRTYKGEHERCQDFPDDIVGHIMALSGGPIRSVYFDLSDGRQVHIKTKFLLEFLDLYTQVGPEGCLDHSWNVLEPKIPKREEL